MMRSAMRRGLSLLLVLVMLFTMLPVEGYAAWEDSTDAELTGSGTSTEDSGQPVDSEDREETGTEGEESSSASGDPAGSEKPEDAPPGDEGPDGGLSEDREPELPEEPE